MKFPTRGGFLDRFHGKLAAAVFAGDNFADRMVVVAAIVAIQGTAVGASDRGGSLGQFAIAFDAGCLFHGMSP